MTIGPEDFDLTDDNGRLRPEVARALQEVPDRPLVVPAGAAPPAAALPPAPPIPPAAAPPVRAEAPWPVLARQPAPVALPVRPADDRHRTGLPVRELTLTVPDLAAARVSLIPLLLIVVLTAIVASFLGTRVALRSMGPETTKSEISHSLPQSPPTRLGSPAPSTSATVSGINVNMRTGPGLGFPVAARLMPGEGLSVREEREGWCAVTTAAGASGWVYAALIRGRNEPGERPAVVRRLFVSDGFGVRVVLRPGQKVLRLGGADGSSTALLPDGRRVAVPGEVLVDAD